MGLLVCSTTKESDEEAEEAPETLIPKLVARVRTIDEEMAALGATVKGGFGRFSDYWIDRKVYAGQLEAFAKEIEWRQRELRETKDLPRRSDANGCETVQLKNGRWVSARVLAQESAHHGAEIERQELMRKSYVYGRKPYNAEALDPKLKALNDEKGELVLRLRKLECEGHESGLPLLI
jgi:predicted RNA-binding protein with PIN domain